MRLINNRRQEPRHGHRATRCLALMFSVLTMIGSGFIIGFGIQTLVEVSFTATVIGNNEIVYCPYLLIVVGILSFVMTPVGFYSIILNDKKVMVTHMGATFFLGTLCAMTAVLGYDLNAHVSSKEMETWMKTTIKEDYGNPIAPHIAEEWNKAHQQFKCCGVRNLNDFVKSKWFMMQKKLPRQRIPESCCASCSTMHERFCVAFFKKPEEMSDKLMKNQTICLQASKGCLSADSSIANREICLQRTLDFSLSVDAFQYTSGCLDPIRTTLEFFSFRIFIYSSAFCVILLLSTLLWLVVHEIRRPILPFWLLK